MMPSLRTGEGLGVGASPEAAMPLDPSMLFIRACLGEDVPSDQLAHLDPGWQELVQAALDATSTNRRAALVLAKAGQADTGRLLEVLGGIPQPERVSDAPWPDPVPFVQSRLP